MLESEKLISPPVPVMAVLLGVNANRSKKRHTQMATASRLRRPKFEEGAVSRPFLAEEEEPPSVPPPFRPLPP